MTAFRRKGAAGGIFLLRLFVELRADGAEVGTGLPARVPGAAEPEEKAEDGEAGDGEEEREEQAGGAYDAVAHHGRALACFLGEVDEGREPPGGGDGGVRRLHHVGEEAWRVGRASFFLGAHREAIGAARGAEGGSRARLGAERDAAGEGTVCATSRSTMRRTKAWNIAHDGSSSVWHFAILRRDITTYYFIILLPLWNTSHPTVSFF